MNNLRIIKENSDKIQLTLYNDDELYRLGDNEYIVFTVRKNINDKNYLIRKKVTSDDFDRDNQYYPIPILPSDTENIEIPTIKDDVYCIYDITLYDEENPDFEKTLYRGNFVVSWRASKGSDADE